MKKWAALIVSVYLFVIFPTVAPPSAVASGAGLWADLSTPQGLPAADTTATQSGQVQNSYGASSGSYSSGTNAVSPSSASSGAMRPMSGSFTPGAVQGAQSGPGFSNNNTAFADLSQTMPPTLTPVTNSLFDCLQNPAERSLSSSSSQFPQQLSSPFAQQFSSPFPRQFSRQFPQQLSQQIPQQCQQQIQQQCRQQCQKTPLPLQQKCQSQCRQQLQQQLLQQMQQMGESGGSQGGAAAELSTLERSMSGVERDPNDRQKPIPFAVNNIFQYGYSFFQGGTPFSPLTDIPVGPEYVIGSGDRIILTAWGSLEGTYELEVNRNGEIALPKVGTIKLQGVTYGRLPQVLKSNLARVFKDFQLSATLGRTRLIKVYLVGEVVSPGDYSISSLATVINALGAAGGPTKNGSLRNIQIKRGGAVAEGVDLYDFFLKGDKSRDVRLQPGDTIFVPSIGPVAGIAGNVRRPAIYELKDEKTLKELIALANGINPSGYLQRVLITRTVPHEKTVAKDFSLDPALGASQDDLTAGIVVKDQDYVKIFPIDTTLRGYIRLDGYILRPGDYALRPGMKISELLKKENLLPEYAEGSAELVRLIPPDYHPEYLSFSPAKALSGDPLHNLDLWEFDKIRIFSRWELEEVPRVRVYGEVQKPGDYRLMRNMTVRDLLLQAGNPKLTAYLAKADIVRTKSDGVKVTSFPVSFNIGEALKGNSRENILLESLDELYVKRIPNWLEETERYATIKGEVLFPGTYPIFKGERLADLIKRAGGYTDKAYLFGAKFTRQSVQKLQQERLEEVMAKMQNNIVKTEQDLAATATKDEMAAAKIALDELKSSMQKIQIAKAEGRVAIKLEPLDKMHESPHDLELLGGDVLDIPQSTMAVTVLGEVASATSTIWLPGKDVSYYLEKAGGVTDNADSDEMYVFMADGSVRGKMSDGMFSIFRLGGFLSTKLHPGDTLVVPQRLERISWMKEIKDIATILGNLAVSAGVPLAIFKR